MSTNTSHTAITPSLFSAHRLFSTFSRRQILVARALALEIRALLVRADLAGGGPSSGLAKQRDEEASGIVRVGQ